MICTTSRDATAWVTSVVPQAAVNSALAGVSYDSANNFNGSASVGVTIDDGANGPQGSNPTGTVSITVNSVNDAPAGTDKTVAINEDATYPFAAADFGFSDPQDLKGGWRSVGKAGSLRKQRELVVKKALTAEPETKPGEKKQDK